MVLAAHTLRTCCRSSPSSLTSTSEPEFSWKFSSSDASSAFQTAYEIHVSPSEEDFCEDTLVWNSGKVKTPEPFGVIYSGQRLESIRRYYWRVRLWDLQDSVSDWSEVESIETGVLDPSHWKAQWIRAPSEFGNERQVGYFRRTIHLDSELRTGRAFFTALGWYRLFINDKDVTGNALVPRWTHFDHEVEYQSYDVSGYFQLGDNEITIVVADGRYRGHLGFFDRSSVYGDRLAVYGQFHLELSNGAGMVCSTDTDWKVSKGSIQRSDPKHGEFVDLRVSLCEGHPVEAFSLPDVKLIGEDAERVQEIQQLPPQKILKTPSDKQLIDFGQTFAGRIRVKLAGKRGDRVTLTYSEIVGQDGELDIHYLDLPFGNSLMQDQVIPSARESWFEPLFTIHGFRYVEIDGLDYTLQDADVQGIVISSNLIIAGSFNCSDPRLNRLDANVFWSMRSNFLDTPTDCPTREQSGWTGDIQVFSRTATLFMDVQAYLRRFLLNMTVEQFDDGAIPPIIPSETSRYSGSTPSIMRYVSSSVGWGDCCVIIPWNLYQYYGDRQVLRSHYESMCRWVDFLGRRARGKRSWTRRLLTKNLGDLEEYIVDTGFDWGEWLRPGEGFGRSLFNILFGTGTVGTAYFAYSATLLAKIASILGKHEDARRYGELSTQVKTAWRAAFVRDGGRRIGDEKQDDYVRAIAFDLLLPEEKNLAINRLADLIVKADYHVATGFLSTALLLPVLSDHGRADLAFRLLLQETQPSWLHMVNSGATTIWESWEGYTKNGRATGSHNHYSLGAFASWFREGIAGLSPAEPGYRAIKIAPHVGGGLTHANASVETPFGTARSSWYLSEADNIIHLEITVPPGTTATVHQGEGIMGKVGPGTHSFSWKQS